MSARPVLALLVLTGVATVLPIRAGSWALAATVKGPTPEWGNHPGAINRKISPATMPQFWLTDASIFIHNAASVLSGIFAEESLGSRDSELLANQARTASRLLARARESLQTLEANAEASNPGAVVAIRSAVSELAAAQNELTRSHSSVGRRAVDSIRGLGLAMLRPILAHLSAAQAQMPVVAKEYLDRNAALAFIPLDGAELGRRNMAGESRVGSPRK